MKLLLFYSCVLAFAIGIGHCSENDHDHDHDVDRLVRVLNALTRALNYFHERVTEINLDAVFCVRVVQEQLHAFLTNNAQEFHTYRNKIEELRDKAKLIADQGRLLVLQNDPKYAARIGFWMDESPRIVFHPSRKTRDEFVESYVKCSTPYDNLNGTLSDICFSQIGANATNRCNISQECFEMETKPNQRDFIISHQMLYWRFMESYKCVDGVAEKFQQRLCSNVMRDAKRIAAADYPMSHQDLFMEQVGLCGLWGFSDFNKPDWIDQILDWQNDSGCYSGYSGYSCTDDLQPDPPIRVKRSERLLSDNCYSHKTAVAVIALVTNLRFEAEKAFQGIERSQNTNIQMFNM